MSDLELRQDGEVVWATMNRPGRLNALSRGLVNELREFFVGLYWRRDVRVVVLRGAGAGRAGRRVRRPTLQSRRAAFGFPRFGAGTKQGGLRRGGARGQRRGDEQQNGKPHQPSRW